MKDKTKDAVIEELTESIGEMKEEIEELEKELGRYRRAEDYLWLIPKILEEDERPDLPNPRFEIVATPDLRFGWSRITWTYYLIRNTIRNEVIKNVLGESRGSGFDRKPPQVVHFEYKWHIQHDMRLFGLRAFSIVEDQVYEITEKDFV